MKDALTKNKHFVKEPNCHCQLKCDTKICFEQQKILNDRYWNMSWEQQGMFLKLSCVISNVKRKTTSTVTGTSTKMERHTHQYFLKSIDDQMHRVCQTFFLSILGYKRGCSTILKRLNKTTEEITVENRGKYERDGVDQLNDQIKMFIEQLNPTISHYRREHAPNRRYLPSDNTIKDLHELFLADHPNVKCGYEKFRVIFNEMNITITNLGHEECEQCQIYKLHESNHGDDGEGPSVCTTCEAHKTHLERANNSRSEYQKMSNEANFDINKICVSVDLQKVIMLPRLEMFKRIIFAKRITAFNESFVPLGKWTGEKRPMAILWHEGVSGRKKEDLCSTFLQFLLYHR